MTAPTTFLAVFEVPFHTFNTRGYRTCGTRTNREEGAR